LTGIAGVFKYRAAIHSRDRVAAATRLPGAEAACWHNRVRIKKGGEMAKNNIVQLDDYRGGPPDAGADRDICSRGKRNKQHKKARHDPSGFDWTFGGFTTPTPFLTDLMNAFNPQEPLEEAERLLQSGVLAYRRAKNGEPRILLISKKNTGNWGIPKGNVEPHISFPESAAKEAFEEAGVSGRISPYPIGMLRTRKRVGDARSHRTIEVWMYLLEVTEAASNWPEKHKRQAKWVSCETAARLLREPVLAQLCHRLAQN
jgi:8-oxo-dGTP pyrophosphatase MutT (NUDIX family)